MNIYNKEGSLSVCPFVYLFVHIPVSPVCLFVRPPSNCKQRPPKAANLRVYINIYDRDRVSVGAVGAAAPTLFLDKGSCTHRFGVGVKKSGYICTHTFEFLTRSLLVVVL